jgi:hypothetical protein
MQAGIDYLAIHRSGDPVDVDGFQDDDRAPAVLEPRAAATTRAARTGIRCARYSDDAWMSELSPSAVIVTCSAANLPGCCVTSFCALQGLSPDGMAASLNTVHLSSDLTDR